MKKTHKSSGQTDHHKMFLAAVIVIVTLVLLTVMNARFSRQYPDGSPATNYSVTPIVMPKGATGWKKFTHPSYRFTFMYPEKWKITLTKSSERDREYTLVLIYTEGGRDYRVNFMRGGRGAANFDSVKRDTLDYGGHTAYKNTYIKDGAPVEEVITFRDMNIISPFIAIDAQLPRGGSGDYEKLIDRIASSIERTK